MADSNYLSLLLILQTVWTQIIPCRAWSGSKLFDTLMVFLKEFFENFDFEKNPQMTKKIKNIQGAKSSYPTFVSGVNWDQSEQTTLLIDFSCIHCRLQTFFKTIFFFQKILSGANDLDPNQDQPFVGPDLDPNCLHRLSAGSKSWRY